MNRRLIPASLLLILLSGCKLTEEMVSHRDREREPSNSSKRVGSEIATIRPQHPRLLLTREDFDRVREMCHGQDPLASAWFNKLHSRAVQLLDDPPVKFSHPLISASREAFIRIVTLAGVYRLSGDERFAKRARDELLAVAKFPDWNPQDFLATGEMCAAVSVGYDWLYDTLSQEDRGTLADAILDKALDPGLHGFKNKDGWTTNTGNWNFVCNGGLIMGALAVADVEPKTAEQFVSFGIDSMRDAIKSFDPDGGWEEGPSYWNYATRYLVYSLAALQTSGAGDGGLSSAPGFSRTGLFRIAMQGPTGKLFNFGDCDEHTGACPQMFWLARRFKQPAFAQFEAQQERDEPTMLDLLWYQPSDSDTRALDALPTAIVFRNVNVAAIRSSWTDPNATYVALKGGSNAAHHTHLDLGTFVLDALGERWAIDLGAENYNLPGYSDVDSRRWTFYRAMTTGQNTITIDNENQATDGVATIIGAQSDCAVADLSRGYKNRLHAWRGVRLIDGRNVLLQDELQSDEGRQFIWSMHTRAKIKLEGATAILEQNGKTMRVEILSPATAKFELASANPPPPQTQNPDVRKLVIRIPRTKSETTIAVMFSPLPADQTRAAKMNTRLQPLKDWISSARTKERD